MIAQSHKGIDRFQVFKSSKVTICRPQRRHAVFNTDRCSACIVKLPALKFGFSGQRRQDAPVLRATMQDMCLWRSEPGVDLRKGLLVFAGGIENLWIRND